MFPALWREANSALTEKGCNRIAVGQASVSAAHSSRVVLFCFNMDDALDPKKKE